MNTYSSMEEYAEHIRVVTGRQLAALCRSLGPEHATTSAIEQLCTEAANIVHQSKMKQEQASGYDLAALRVDATSASNSETGWEREE